MICVDIEILDLNLVQTIAAQGTTAGIKYSLGK